MVDGVTDLRPISSDGTVVHGWETGDGTPVLLANGLGAGRGAWPGIVAPTSGLHVVGWNYRGLGGSPPPADRRNISVDHHVDDAIAVMDAAGMDRALVASWSVGVNVAFELAVRHPDRVTGILAVCGVPGGTFASMFGPTRLPGSVRRGLAVSAARLLRSAGPLVGAVSRRVEPTPATVRRLVRLGLVDDGVDVETMRATLDGFAQHDFRWYFTLALAIARHARMDLTAVDCPVIFAIGRSDLLASRADVALAAAQLPHAELELMTGTHYLPIEQPTAMLDLLNRLAARCVV